MSLFGLEFPQMILHTETSKLMYNWSFLFEVLHKPTLLPRTNRFWQVMCEMNRAFQYNLNDSVALALTQFWIISVQLLSLSVIIALVNGLLFNGQQFCRWPPTLPVTTQGCIDYPPPPPCIAPSDGHRLRDAVETVSVHHNNIWFQSWNCASYKLDAFDNKSWNFKLSMTFHIQLAMI